MNKLIRRLFDNARIAIDQIEWTTALWVASLVVFALLPTPWDAAFWVANLVVFALLRLGYGI